MIDKCLFAASEPTLSRGGALLLAAKIDGKPGPVQTPRDPVLIRNRFMKGLSVGKAGALD